MSSVFGLLFQFALLIALGSLIWGWWRADRAAAVAQMSPRELADAYRRDRETVLPELGSDGESKPGDRNSIRDKAQLRL